ncbi:XTP/dITP diphosphatase [Fructilactobacillus fructivorans]|uniref:dITP/XTP pyrophosphatase n=1 Tax=Fructilactobacillus fructivorans TaxID=1614 RepID=A0A0C1Q0Z9_9LACO|nr:XTP/dITP diphosphatase [Fructilactobacillus fructivorans]KID41543.1 Nucleoside 5-triphosphatase RdgB (dHAPTP, dITP, XTP-specific) [Fructilactobacillus fructivorans]MCT0151194.1 XTP/dITP diphosphatase [Fructilactobacillus fructivorans]MCT2867729.1 XTP/dITP diphosphatase [Fructilactobacillus fructivorans]MCT2868753.1 XTP/dITP diphosphatase [Fructilactobacillus fructivorans]MCT2874077.1 XTP/dITP diphosphatase [Fructilactobacillus fructivorans]
MKNNQIVVASKNPGKINEFTEMLSKLGLTVKSINDFDNVPAINENGTTFEENATIKAKVVSEYLDLPVLADDSGLVVDALNGAPGIHSARYAGDHNDQANKTKLLRNMQGKQNRNAHFNTTLIVRKPNGKQLVVVGRVDGQIVETPRGTNGFGYDPLFYLPELGKTLAQLTDEQKNAYSARGNALRKLTDVIEDWW